MRHRLASRSRCERSIRQLCETSLDVRPKPQATPLDELTSTLWVVGWQSVNKADRDGLYFVFEPRSTAI